MKKEIATYLDMQKSVYDYNIDETIYDAKKIIGATGPLNDEGAIIQTTKQLFDNNTYTDKVALDFGCGIGRMIKWFIKLFKRIDGVDISSKLIRLGKTYLMSEGVESNLFECNGYDLSNIGDEQYDMIYSAYVLEHICVHDIRHNLFKEFFRVLRSPGQISILMKGCEGYTCKSSYNGWYANNYHAHNTNSLNDVGITNVFYVAQDLISIGYSNIRFYLEPINRQHINPPPEFAGHTFVIVIKADKI